ncbi:MAG: T9SS type A sorting domain-containing protein [Armatimonadetes bacterium]|nr:T9SS type A sorting domain-containing protein [Armatimonadota bacterium]
MNASVSIPTRQRTAAILTLLVVLAVGTLRAQTVEIAWQTIGTGGLADNQQSVSFTLGQPVVDVISGAGAGLNATLYLGFWLPLAKTTAAADAPLQAATTTTLHAVPNPFSTATAVICRLKRAGHISVVIFDLLGRPVRQLVSGMMESGTHTIAWDGADEQGEKVPAGNYLCRIETDNSTGERSTGSLIIQHL